METKITGTEYTERLRKKFNQLNQSAEWAQLPSRTDEKTESEFQSLLKSTASLRQAPTSLPQGTLGITRMKDANIAERAKSAISSLQFHPNGELLLTAGLDKSVRLFQVDGLRNPKVQGIFIPDLPIMTAAFSQDGREVIASGRKKYFYSLDLAHGAVNKIPYIRGRHEKSLENFVLSPEIGRAVQQECRDRSRMPSSA
eukprot:TRINITY_DN814_c0_g2_i3.p1 TRINITY_DN814_c0_g2~~TRINITY_DN814_c0_g2_i3.p1  ORF type:complete len:199 (+),score=36.26 TRINITY_DN814_c0_g2_i3:384-980(+)